jgi:hypothetical protein
MKQFIDINEYFLFSREKRREHLKLEDPCIEIGGDSKACRALLAHFLGTTIGGKRHYVCHACNNPKCSNVFHLYWGTPHDNWLDTKNSGRWESPYERMLKKYSKNELLKNRKDATSKAGKSSGGLNALKEEDLSLWKEAIDKINIQEFGWVSKLSKEMKVSHTHVRRILKKYFSELKPYERKPISLSK